MSNMLAAWLCGFALLSVLSFFRPVWGVAVYMLTFFACPAFWWWGDPIEGYRWNLYGGVVLLAAVGLSRFLGSTVGDKTAQSQGIRRIKWFAGAILLNATFVHFMLAPNLVISSDSYFLLAKFVLLFFLISMAIQTPKDFRIVLFVIVLGAGYIGYEATINDRGKIEGSRLEGIGAPGASQANQCASLMVTILPIAGGLFLTERRWGKLLILVVTPLILNVILLCNSRGAFLGAIATGVVFLAAAPPQVRKRAFKLIALGIVAVWVLLGDPRIIERFYTTFASEEERDSSAAGRIVFAKAGLEMIADHPLGAGGDGFKEVYGRRYLDASYTTAEGVRSVHNGFINEACEWGIQGFLLRMGFVVSALLCAFSISKRIAREGHSDAALIGACIIAATIGFLVTCVFGDRLDNEWGYWMAALAAGYVCVYSSSTQGPAHGIEPESNEFDKSHLEYHTSTPVGV